MRPSILLLLWVAFTAFAPVQATAQARHDADFVRSGPYLALALTGGFSTRFANEAEEEFPFSLEVDPSAGVLATAGYRFHPRFAAEFQFEWLDEFDISTQNIEIASLQIWATTINTKGFLTTGRFQLFALVGIGALYGELQDSLNLGLSVDETDFAARFGGGVDFYATPHFVLNFGASYVLPTGDVEDLDYVSLGAGATIRF